MNAKYKGCTLEALREDNVFGDEIITGSAFRDEDGREVATLVWDWGKVRDMMGALKLSVDEYLEEPENFE